MAAAHSGTASSRHGVDLIDKNNTGRMPLRLRKHITHTGSAYTDKHLHEIRTGNAEEWHIGLPRDRLGKQRLTRTRRTFQQNAFGNTCPYLRKFARLPQEFYDLLQLFLLFLQACHAIQFDLILTAQRQFGPAPAEIHHLAVTAATGRILCIHHHEKENADHHHDQDRKYTVKKPALLRHTLHHRIQLIAAHQLFCLGDIRHVQPSLLTTMQRHFKRTGIGILVRTDLDNGDLIVLHLPDKFAFRITAVLDSDRSDPHGKQQQSHDDHKIHVETLIIPVQNKPLS